MRKNRSNASKISRITITLPETVDVNLDFFCLCVGKGKSEIVIEAVVDFLMEKGGIDAYQKLKLELPNLHPSYRNST